MRRTDGVGACHEAAAGSASDARLSPTEPTEVATEPASLVFPHIPVAGLRDKAARKTYYFRVFEGDVKAKSAISIGRGRYCDIRLNRRRVSRLHCMIVRVNGLWTIRDKSTNGTIIYRPEDPIAQLLGDMQVVLSLSMQILIDKTIFLPVADDGRIGLFALHQKHLRRQARSAYENADEAGKKIGCSTTTIYDANHT